jgi:anaerobic selenocysteine-containing dehydrogenase
VVTFDLFKTPTAQLSDYILPGNSWLERDHLHDLYGWSTVHFVSHKLMDAPGECRGGYELWRGLAQRMGFGERFPWRTTEELYDERLQGTGMNWAEFSDTYTTYIPEFKFKKYEQTGFATPSGKVELYSSVLEDLGHDPLPYYRERPQPEGFPFILFVGIRDDEYYQTGQRQVKSLRQRGSYPVLMINPADAAEHDLVDGEWAEIESPAGSISLKVGTRAEIPRGSLRIPRGWWFPEMDEGGESLSGAWLSSDAVLMPDDDDYLDREQGVADMTCVPGRIRSCPEPEWVERAKQAGFIKE